MAKIETEKMLIQMVETELEKRKQAGAYKGQFMGQSHFFGYFHAICFFNEPNRYIIHYLFNDVNKTSSIYGL